MLTYGACQQTTREFIQYRRHILIFTVHFQISDISQPNLVDAGELNIFDLVLGAAEELGHPGCRFV